MSSGIQVNSVLPEGTIYSLGLASDANFIYAVATTFGAPIFCRKKKKKKKCRKKKTKKKTTKKKKKLNLRFIKIKCILYEWDLGYD